MDVNLSQPKGLKILFFGESVQRFSCYGIQAVLLIFLLKVMSFSAESAYRTYGIFTAFSFILAILGGLIADKWLGFRRVLLIGITLSLIGNLLLALHTKSVVMLGLSFTLCGLGLFLPNNSNLLGSCYKIADSRRNRGFTLFYVGTNVGGLLGPIIYGVLASRGWNYPFLISSAFLVFWIIFYFASRNVFKGYGDPPMPSLKKGYHALFCLGVLGLVVSVAILLTMPIWSGRIIIGIGVISLLLIIISGFRRNKKERNTIFLLILMILCALLFFASVFQIYTSLIIFIQHHVDRYLFYWIIPSSSFASLEPFFIILLSPIIARVWKELSAKAQEPSPLAKMALGLLFGGCGFGVFALAAYHASRMGSEISVFWIFAGNAFLSIGEVCIMPTLISAITEYAPEKIRATIMGLLYLSLAFSGYFASLIGKLTINSKVGSMSYFSVYSKIFVFGIGVGLFLFVVTQVVRHYFASDLFMKKRSVKM